jgi:hypothetical protein
LAILICSRHPREQLPRRKRLYQIVVGVGLQSQHARFFTRPRGQQDHGRTGEGRIVANGSQQAESIRLRHHDVGQHQGWAQLFYRFERLAAVCNRAHLIAVA